MATNKGTSRKDVAGEHPEVSPEGAKVIPSRQALQREGNCPGPGVSLMTQGLYHDVANLEIGAEV